MRKLASFMGLMLLILTTSIFTSCKEPIPEPKVYTVTFDAAGGSEVAAIKVKSGEKAIQPEDPTKEGFVFDAWYNGDAKYNWETPVTADITLTAKWTDKVYTVTFDADGGSEVAAIQVKSGEKAVQPEDPTKEGCVFAGWLNGETAYDFELPVTSDLVLTAKWDVAKYLITFEVEGVKAIEVEYGKVAEEPAAPTKDGYTFKGWMNGDVAYDWTKEVKADVKLTASWEAIKYTITYLPEGIETDNPKEYTIESEEITLKDPTKAPDAAKPNFLQWRAEKEDGDVVTKIEKGSTGNKIFYAEYTDKKTYKVTFMDGDKAVGEASTVIEGEKVKLPTDYAKYDLYSDKECKTAFDVTKAITADTTIYVKVKTFTVTFDSDGGSEVKAITVEYGKVATKPETDPTKEGDVKFNGWYNGDTAYDWTTKVTSNLTLKAQWKALEIYTVTFDSDGGSSVESKTVKEGQKATEPKDPTKEGYTFKGWFAEGEKTAYDFNKAVTSNLKLKAAWDKKIFSIKLNVSDGIEEDPSNFKIIKSGYGDEVTQTLVEETLKADIPTREGYKFTGWKVTEKLPFTVEEAKTINVTAQWAKLYAVTFDGGEPIYVEEGSKVTKPADPTKEGYTFAAWLNGDVEFDFSKPVMDNLNLTSKWVEIVVQNGEIKVKKGLCSPVAIELNDPVTNQYQHILEIFANNATYKATKDDKIVINIKGTSDKKISELKFFLVDNSEAAGWWKRVSDYVSVGEIPVGEFEKVIVLPMVENADTSGSTQKLVIYYENGTESTTLTFTSFEINGRSSLAPFNREGATLINKWTKAEMDAIKDFSIDGTPAKIGEGNLLNSSDVYCVITVNLTDEAKIGWGAGAISNYQNNEVQAISLSGNQAGEHELIYSLEEIYDAIKIKGVETPEYFSFNLWGEYLEIISVEILKM